MVESELPLSLARDPGNRHLLNRLAELEAYDFKPVREHAQERLGWDDAYASKVERKTKQFMALSYLEAGQAHAPEADVDELWHSMVLHTRWYHAFCSAIFGQYYHHTPEPAGSALDDDRRDRSVAATKTWFGEGERSALLINCRRCQPMFTATPGLTPNT